MHGERLGFDSQHPGWTIGRNASKKNQLVLFAIRLGRTLKSRRYRKGFSAVVVELTYKVTL